MASSTSIQAGRAFISLEIDNSNLRVGLKNANSLLSGFASKASMVLQNIVNTERLFRNILRPVISLYGDFDDQMRLTKAVTGATAEQFGELAGRAKQLGRDTAFTASQVASAMTALGRMGFSSAEVDTAISSVMDLQRTTDTVLYRLIGHAWIESAESADGKSYFEIVWPMHRPARGGME